MLYIVIQLDHQDFYLIECWCVFLPTCKNKTMGVFIFAILYMLYFIILYKADIYICWDLLFFHLNNNHIVDWFKIYIILHTEKAWQKTHIIYLEENTYILHTTYLYDESIIEALARKKKTSTGDITLLKPVTLHVPCHFN